MPEQKKTGTVNALFALFVSVSVGLFVWSVVLGWQEERTYGSLVSLVAMAFLLAGLFVLARYRLLKFSYIIRPRDDRDDTGLLASYASVGDVPYYMLDFAVYKSVGAREPRLQCVLSVEDFREAYDMRKGHGAIRDIKKKYEAENGGKFIYYDYTLTPNTVDGLCLIFLDGNKYVGVLIEADEKIKAFFEEIA